MAIYYVRPEGNNTNAGTGYLASLAWATISKAASVMVTGDTCYVAPGTYRETVTLTNSGASGNPITYLGDRKCQYFLDKTPGDVIISGMNNETDTTITRSVGFTPFTVNYINITNIDFENISSVCISLGTYCNISNCNMVKGCSSGISLKSYATITNCKIFSITNYAIQLNDIGSILRNCILKSCSLSDVIYFSGSFSAELDHCIIEGSYIPVNINTTLNLFGCVWNCGFSAINGRSIKLDATSKVINAKGTTFIGKGSYFDIMSASFFYGCKFRDFLSGLNILTGSGIPDIRYCEFEGNGTGIALAINGEVVPNCYFKNNVTSVSGFATTTLNNCRFYANANAPTTVVNNTPTYGEIDVLAGTVASPTNPISGTKSLKIAGYDYGSVFTQWIPCEAGKQKTVKVKVKRNSATFGTTIRLGDQCVGISGNIKFVGSGWSSITDASASGGKFVNTKIKDDYIEYTFVGTGIRYIGLKSLALGIVGISIDGGAETNTDLYNASALYQQNLFEVTGLTNGTHKIKVRVTGTKNASATDFNVYADAFQVYNGSWSANAEAETTLTSVETIEVTYTHHKTELVPLFINPRVNSNGGDFIQIDDIQAA